MVDGVPCEDAEQLEELAQVIEQQWQGADEVPAARPVVLPETRSGPVSTGTVGGLRVKLKLDRDFDTFMAQPEEKKHLMRKIWEELSCPSAREVSIRKGCVELILDLTPEEAERLYWAAKRGELDGFGLIEVEKIDAPAPPTVEGELSPEAGAAEDDEGQGPPLALAGAAARPGPTAAPDGYVRRSEAAVPLPSTSFTLLERVRTQNTESWRQLVLLYTPLLYRWCRQDRLPASDVEDVIQEVWQKVVRGLATFSSEKGRFRSWLKTLTRHAVVEYFRRSCRRARSDPGAAVDEVQDSAPSSPVGMGGAAEQALLLQRALELIRPEFQQTAWEAFRLCMMERQSAKDVAAALGMSVSAVYLANSRIMGRLRTILDDFLA
jgi:RNA polymerase sigma-70 factor (ECF subfamily)